MSISTIHELTSTDNLTNTAQIWQHTIGQELLKTTKGNLGKVLIRADFNVPLKNGKVSDDLRIRYFLPCLLALKKLGARKIIILSHLGRPDGRPVPEFSLSPVFLILKKLTGEDITFLPDCLANNNQTQINQAPTGSIFLLENLRFYAGEEENNNDFAKSLAKLGDIYINEAFSVSHRAHASVVALAQLLPSYVGTGFLAEMHALDKILGKAQKPNLGIIGGAKISSKIGIIKNLLPKFNQLAIAGAMANSFLKAKNISIGASLYEEQEITTAEKIMAEAKKVHCEIILPLDYQVARVKDGNIMAGNLLVGQKNLGDELHQHDMILDIGDKTIAHLTSILQKTKTLLWNGPLGAFEITPFERGTVAVAQMAAQLTNAKKLITIAGGGDTASALAKAGVMNDFTYISTAGGAFLEFLEGKELPGITALNHKP